MAMKTRQYKKGMWNKWVMGAALCGLVLTPAVNALAGDVDVPITAIVQSTLQEEKTADMNFGTIPLNPLGDKITIAAQGGVKTAKPTSEKLVPITGGGAGVITVTAKGPFDVTAQVPATAELTGTDPSNTLEVSAIQTNSDHNSAITATAGTAGTHKAEVCLGGVLTLPEGTVADTYSGEITVSLAYN